MTTKRKDTKKRVLKDGEYQRSNGTYEYRWQTKTGKRKSIYGRTLEELREKEESIIKDRLDGIQPVDKSMCINDLYYRWKQLKRGLKTNTFSNYCYMYTQFVEKGFGQTKLCMLKKTDVRAFYNSLADNQGLKVSTIDSIHTVLHQVLEIGVEDDYLRYNPSDNALKELKSVHDWKLSDRRALTRAEQQVFENFLANSKFGARWQPVFTIMLYTGMRVGEITGLRWCDVDFENNIINVNHTLVYFSNSAHKAKYGTACAFAVNTPKTKASNREIPMLPIVIEMFKKEKMFQQEFEISCQSSIDGYTDFIFVNRFGEPQHQGTLNKALKRIIRDCNYKQIDSGKNGVTLPPFSCHYLRHTFTTRMCEAGINIKAMQDILGHADADTTMNIYAEATKEMKTSSMQDFDDYYKRLTTDLPQIYHNIQ